MWVNILLNDWIFLVILYIITSCCFFNIFLVILYVITTYYLFLLFLVIFYIITIYYLFLYVFGGTLYNHNLLSFSLALQPEFSRLANYLAESWSPIMGCQTCKENTISLEGVKTEDFPLVQLALFVDQPTPFLEEFFENIGLLDYPKSRMNLYIRYAVSTRGSS